MAPRKREADKKTVSKKGAAKKPGSSAKRAPRQMPAFTKPSAKTLDAFARAVDGVSGIEHRTMFGYPSVFLNGNMLACVFQDRIMVRLAEADRADAISSVGGKPFEPSPGRAMREYVELPRASPTTRPNSTAWLQRGRAYVRTLPKKAKSKR